MNVHLINMIAEIHHKTYKIFEKPYQNLSFH